MDYVDYIQQLHIIKYWAKNQVLPNFRGLIIIQMYSLITKTLI